MGIASCFQCTIGEDLIHSRGAENAEGAEGLTEVLAILCARSAFSAPLL
jgi:hypothetical protein